MEVSFRRDQGRGYFALARRDDGVLVRLQGFAHDRVDRPLPHDLAHFVVEAELRLTAGLWGVIAAGGLFASTMVVDGRQRPHARVRGQQVKRRAGDRLTEAEVLVRVLCEIARAGEESDPAILDRIPERRRPEGFSADDVRRTCERLRDTAQQWAGVSRGGALHFVWSVGVDTSLADRSRGARSKRRTRSRLTR